MKFTERLQRLGCKTYKEYLEGEHWHAFRLRYYAANGRKCRVCKSHLTELHHQSYDRLGHEEFEDVIPLCGEHHDACHKWLKEHGKPVEKTREWLTVAGCTPRVDPKIAKLMAPQNNHRGQQRQAKQKKALQPQRKCALAACKNLAKRGADLCGLHRPSPQDQRKEAAAIRKAESKARCMAASKQLAEYHAQQQQSPNSVLVIQSYMAQFGHSRIHKRKNRN